MVWYHTIHYYVLLNAIKKLLLLLKFMSRYYLPGKQEEPTDLSSTDAAAGTV
jgi:hypothetical protein